MREETIMTTQGFIGTNVACHSAGKNVNCLSGLLEKGKSRRCPYIVTFLSGVGVSRRWRRRRKAASSVKHVVDCEKQVLVIRTYKRASGVAGSYRLLRRIWQVEIEKVAYLTIRRLPEQP